MRVPNSPFFATAVLLNCIFGLGCQATKDSSSDPSASVRADLKDYELPGEGCTTGKHFYSTQAEYCTDLLDENLNNNCAPKERRATYAAQCAKPAASCFDIKLLPPRGPEISVESFLDGSPGIYRLTSISSMISSKQDEHELSAQFSGTAETEDDLEHPAVSAVETCRQVQLGNDSVEGRFYAPIVIKRENGVLKGGFKGDFSVYGLDPSRDSVDASYSSQSEQPLFQGLIGNSSDPNQSVRVYKINSTTFQMIFTLHKAEGTKSLDLINSAIYILRNP